MTVIHSGMNILIPFRHLCHHNKAAHAFQRKVVKFRVDCNHACYDGSLLPHVAPVNVVVGLAQDATT